LRAHTYTHTHTQVHICTHTHTHSICYLRHLHTVLDRISPPLPSLPQDPLQAPSPALLTHTPAHPRALYQLTPQTCSQDTHTHTHTHTHAHKHTHIDTHTHAHKHKHIHIHTQLNILTNTNTYTPSHTSSHTYTNGGGGGGGGGGGLVSGCAGSARCVWGVWVTATLHGLHRIRVITSPWRSCAGGGREREGGAQRGG